MREVVEKRWNELEPLWDELFCQNANAMPFQSYDFLTFTGKGKPYRKDLFRLIGLKELNLVLYSDGRSVAIAPLLVKKKGCKYFVYFRGHFTTAQALDFIFREWSYEDFKFVMDAVKSRYTKVSFVFDRVQEKSVTCGYLKEYLCNAQIEKHDCFSIPIPENYEDWLGNLHKSARRNLANHKNRLERDQVAVSCDFIWRSPVDPVIAKKMLFVYADRFLIKNDFHFGPLNCLVRKALMVLLQKDKLTQWINSAENNFHAILYFNHEIAAFTSGFICKDGRVLLSRLAIYTKYAQYSPGGQLISSTIQYLTEHNKTGNICIDQLDLSQEGGGGMNYKRVYGGLEHYKYTFTS